MNNDHVILDAPNIIEKKNRRFDIIQAIIVTISIIVWLLLYSAQYLKYDDNIASILLSAVLASVSDALSLYCIFRYKSARARGVIIAIICLCTTTPLHVGFVAKNYENIFGQPLAL